MEQYLLLKQNIIAGIKGGDKWVCLISDAFVSPNIYENCQLAVSDTQPFRNIITPDSKQYSAALAKKKDTYKRYKSKQFTLLKRGTVLFAKDADHLTKIINTLENNNFQTIGYNHYFTNPKTV